MARTKTTEMSTITAAQLADGDWVPVVDVSDTTMSSTGTNKKLAKSQLAEAAGVTAHLADTTDAHDASAISFSATGTISSTDVQAAIAELDSEKAAVAEPIAAAHISDTSDAHDASAISVLDAAGNYTATDVEAVLAELPSRFLTGYSGTTPGIYVPKSWGQFWRAKLLTAGSTPARIAVMGDSISAGYFASNIVTKGYIGLIATSLQTTYGDGGSGFFGVRNSSVHLSSLNSTYGTQFVQLTGTWSSSGVGDGPGMTGIQSTSNGATATYTVRGTKVGIWYLRQSGAGDFTVAIDGGSPVTVSTAGATGAAKYEVTGLSAGTHTIVVTKSGTTRADLHGFFGENTTGVVVNNFSAYGGVSANATGTAGFSNPATYGGGSGYPADLVIWAFGANDANAGAVAADTYIANVRKYLDLVRDYSGATGAVDIMFVMPHLGQFDTSQRGDAYCARLRGMADHFGAAFVNFNAVYRNSWSYFNSLSGWGVASGATPGATGTDSVHPSDTGFQLYANALTPILSATTIY